ncbi:MAG TPA: ImmA/IrrE family metallo-endopeptidase [Dehalococcoidia bacterium]|nr:ImmA/IrrE family metallo-endopeptidase [Dehalococcoidia bacterium]
MADEDKILVLKDQLVKARESLGLELREVADKLGIDEEKIINWEKGKSEPPLEVLWNLAELYERSTDYFLFQAPALPERLSFRLERQKAMQDLPEEVRRIIVRFDELCRAEAEIEQALQKPRKILFEPIANGCSPQELADKERRRLGLDNQPIRDLHKLLTSQGVRIFMLPIPDIPANELSGLSWWHKAYGPCILVNARNNPGRRSFTIAHEYAHLLRADPPTICALMLDIPEERFAHRFAAFFLMPATDVKRSFVEMVGHYDTTPTDQDLGRLANRYRVSLEAMGRRLEDLELIPEGTTNARISEWEKKPTFYRGRRGPRWQHQLGKEFIELALTAHSKGHISISKLAKYFGQDVRKTMEFIEESSSSGSSKGD